MTGLVLMIIAGFCFICTLASAIAPNWFFAILLGILAMIFGNYAFDSFELAAQSKPLEIPPTAEPPIHEIDLISTQLQNGAILNVQVEIHFLNPKQAHHALPRIKANLYRALNRYAPKTAALPEDSYTEIDKLLQESIEPLKSELGLERLTLQTIKIETEKPVTPRAKGTAFGE